MTEEQEKELDEMFAKLEAHEAEHGCGDENDEDNPGCSIARNMCLEIFVLEAQMLGFYDAPENQKTVTQNTSRFLKD